MGCHCSQVFSADRDRAREKQFLFAWGTSRLSYKAFHKHVKESYFQAMPVACRNLSSPTRGQTHDPCSKNADS